MTSAFKSAIVTGVGTTSTTVYTAPSATVATVIGLSISNTSTNQVDIEVTLTKGATTAFLIKNAPLPVGSSLVIIGGDQKVVLETGNYIQIKSSVAASVDTIMSILELT